MTAVIDRSELLSHGDSMPGWNIVADLTPPELINARRIGALRRRIVTALIFVVALCGAGYVYAMRQSSAAAVGADAASAQTADLTRAGAKYAGITRIESTVAGIRAQVAGVMKDDVDVAHQIAAIRAALPPSMSIQNLTLTITADAAATTGAPVGLDASGHAEIGTVTITGSGRRLDDLPAFVDRLVATPGVVNVLPSSNQVSSGSAQFNLTFSLTDKLFTHRYDVTSIGGS